LPAAKHVPCAAKHPTTSTSSRSRPRFRSSVSAAPPAARGGRAPAAATAPLAIRPPCDAGARLIDASLPLAGRPPPLVAMTKRAPGIRRAPSSPWRGTLERGRCVDCGADQVIGLIADPARWRDVVWVCRQHRESELERRLQRQARQVYEATQAVWFDERARVLAAIELLPSDERAQLKALAERGPAGLRLSPGAPLYVMNLVRAYKAR